MNADDLKKLGLTDEAVIEKIIVLHGKDIEKHKKDIETATTELSIAKNQLADANKQIETFKGFKVEDIQKAADDWKAKAEKATVDAAAQISKMKFDNSLNDALKAAKAKDTIAVRAHLNTDQLKLNEADGSIIGLNDQLEKVKKENDYLFEAEGNPPPTIVTGGHNQSIFKGGDVVIDAARKAAGLPPLAGDK